VRSPWCGTRKFELDISLVAHFDVLTCEPLGLCTLYRNPDAHIALLFDLLQTTSDHEHDMSHERQVGEIWEGMGRRFADKVRDMWLLAKVLGSVDIGGMCSTNGSFLSMEDESDLDRPSLRRLAIFSCVFCTIQARWKNWYWILEI